MYFGIFGIGIIGGEFLDFRLSWVCFPFPKYSISESHRSYRMEILNASRSFFVPNFRQE